MTTAPFQNSTANSCQDYSNQITIHQMTSGQGQGQARSSPNKRGWSARGRGDIKCNVLSWRMLLPPGKIFAKLFHKYVFIKNILKLLSIALKTLFHLCNGIPREQIHEILLINVVVITILGNKLYGLSEINVVF